VFYGIKNKGTPQHHKNNTGLLIVKDIVCPGDIPKGMQHRLLQSTCTPMFIAALFTITKLWK
jgi:hypothetical protein